MDLNVISLSEGFLFKFTISRLYSLQVSCAALLLCPLLNNPILARHSCIGDGT